jgi:hypothetical protein
MAMTHFYKSCLKKLRNSAKINSQPRIFRAIFWAMLRYNKISIARCSKRNVSNIFWGNKDRFLQNRNRQCCIQKSLRCLIFKSLDVETCEIINIFSFFGVNQPKKWQDFRLFILFFKSNSILA